jgi:uncharacterized protein YjdB
MQLRPRTAVAMCLAAIGCGGGGGGPAGPAPIESISVTLVQSSIVIGDQTGATATARDASSNVLSGRTMSWSSTNTAVATVDLAGVVTAVAAGTAGITATAEGKSGTANLTVVVPPVAAVTVSLAAPTIAIGATTQASASITDKDGSVLTGRVVTWSSSNSGVATVSNTGLVTGVSAGSANITGTSEGKSGVATITVVPPSTASVTVSLAARTITPRQRTEVTGTAKDANGNILPGKNIVWSSDNTAVATVNPQGVVTGVAVGTANIIGTNEGKTGSAALTVAASAGFGSSSEKIRIVDIGTTFAPTLSGPSAAATTFVSRAPSVATVNALGTITGVGEGQAWIAASAPGFAPDSVHVIVPRNATGPVLRSDLTDFNVQTGTTKVVNIILDTRSTPIGGAELSVGYTTSPNMFFRLSAVPTGNPLPLVNDMGNGVIRVSLASGNALSGQLAIVRLTFDAQGTTPPNILANASGFLTLTLIDLASPTGTDLIPVSTSTRIPILIIQ